MLSAEHLAAMPDQAIVCYGHFDNEIQVSRLEKWPGIKNQHKAAGRQIYFPDDMPSSCLLKAGW